MIRWPGRLAQVARPDGCVRRPPSVAVLLLLLQSGGRRSALTLKLTELMNQTSSPAPAASPRKPQEISGSAVVVGMVTLGVLATAGLFLYFELHTGPFRPLREAIGREFKHSRPNVEGGQVRGRGPWILRISMSVPFDPFTDEARGLEIQERVLEIARQFPDFPKYEQVQLNLIYFQPEKEAKRRTFDWPPKPVSERPRQTISNEKPVVSEDK